MAPAAGGHVRTEDLEFPLPEHLVADRPAAERTASRLLVVRCASGELEHRVFRELPELLRPGDLLVLNDTRVVPARFLARKESGGRVEGLWLEDRGGGLGLCMLSGSRLRPGILLRLGHGGRHRLRLTRREAPGRWLLEDVDGSGWLRILAEAGATPLPPYIRHRRRALGEPEELPEDRERYQTVWARAAGSVAAPTAALHFDEALLDRLRDRGVALAWLTLHVGAGTFLPIRAERLEEHEMHAEHFAAPAATMAALHAARRRGGRVVACGTTVCRVLEHLAVAGAGPSDPPPPEDLAGTTRLFIRPGFPFRWTDALLTNFHTPRSTLLALVAAFAAHAGARDPAPGPPGLPFVKEVYAEAVRREYRFFSYGDASLWFSG